eukprot:SAG31_NODE_4853_length_2904_cov_1.876649_2_plen_210_part_00
MVVATCRDPASSAGLRSLHASDGAHRLHLRKLDLLANDHDAESGIDAAAAWVGALGGGRVDMLINASGVLHSAQGGQPDGQGPERELKRCSREWMMHSFAVNAVGPLLVLGAFAPMLSNRRKMQSKGATAAYGPAAANSASGRRPPAVVANLSARVGSIGDNRLGGWYSYRASKAALNQFTGKTLGSSPDDVTHWARLMMCLLAIAFAQ